MADGALFSFGYGLTYASPRRAWTPLPEDAGAMAGDAHTFLAAGVPAAGWSLHIADPRQPGSVTRLTTFPAEALGGRAQVSVAEGAVQEGARRVRISAGESAVSLSAPEPIDIARETNGDVMLLMTLEIASAPEWAGLAMQDGAGKRAVSTLALSRRDGFTRYGLPLKCLRDKGIDMAAVATPFIFATEGRADFALAEVRLGTDAEVVLPCR
jgi:beta-glucosidase